MSTPVLSLAAAGGALATAALFVSFWPSQRAGAAEISASSERVASLERALEADANSREQLADAVDTLVGRVESLEARSDRQPLSRPAARDLAGAAPRGGEVVTAARTAVDIEPEEFLALMPKVLRVTLEGDATDEDQARFWKARFWKAARTTGLVDDAIEALEARVGVDGRDQEGRMQLADAYVAKLLTVPAGPERGIWGMKAEKQWQSVVDQDPDHWEAQYTLAFNYSMYPDFVSKTEEAIAGFQAVLEIQQRTAPQEQYSQSYVHLARLYGKQRR